MGDGWDGPGNCKARVKRQGLDEAVRQPQNHEVQLQTGFRNIPTDCISDCISGSSSLLTWYYFSSCIF